MIIQRYDRVRLTQKYFFLTELNILLSNKVKKDNLIDICEFLTGEHPSHFELPNRLNATVFLNEVRVKTYNYNLQIKTNWNEIVQKKFDVIMREALIMYGINGISQFETEPIILKRIQWIEKLIHLMRFLNMYEYPTTLIGMQNSHSIINFINEFMSAFTAKMEEANRTINNRTYSCSVSSQDYENMNNTKKQEDILTSRLMYEIGNTLMFAERLRERHNVIISHEVSM